MTEALSTFVRPGFLPDDECAAWCAEMDQAPRQTGAVRDPDQPDTDRVEPVDRRAFDCDVSDETTRSIVERVARVAPEVAGHFAMALTQSEVPHFVRYEPGGFYRPHRDIYVDLVLPEPLASRRVSVVVFLNDDFAGGVLRLCSHEAGAFESRNAIDVASEPGLLVAFRADTWHEVTPITHGVRSTIVTLLHAPRR